jgi:hypothetical protein
MPLVYAKSILGYNERERVSVNLLGGKLNEEGNF